MREFENDKGHMMFGGMRAEAIADTFGTPVYAVDENIIRENYRKIYDAFAKHMDTRVYYACKANSSLAVLKILEQEGSFADVLSAGEAMTCIKAGFPASRMMYTSTCVSNAELKAITELGITVNVDSVSELERLAKIRTGIEISVRVNPDVGSGECDKTTTGSKGSKFGIPEHAVISTYRRASELGLKPIGIHAHIGSGGPPQAVGPFIETVSILAEMANEVKDECNIDLKMINMGGGIGVPYRPNEPEMDIEELASSVTEIVTDETSVKTFALEPGRYVVCDSAVLLTRCNDVKDAGIKKYVCVDAGFNTLIRPAMYGSHHHVAIANKFNKAGEGKYDVVGPICETGDHIARDRALPAPDEGDLIAVYNCGAYGFSMSSTYNSRPRCREVLVKDGKAELIRDSETAEDLWRHQTIPERLL